jgi:hypothetical protein
MADTTADRPFRFSPRTIYAAAKDFATRPRRFRFRITSLLLAITVPAAFLAWSGHGQRKRAVMLESIQLRGGYVVRSDYQSVSAIGLPADATIEEMQVLSRYFPRASIMKIPEPSKTP